MRGVMSTSTTPRLTGSGARPSAIIAVMPPSDAPTRNGRSGSWARTP
jgi:hypothetical protein